MASLGPRGPRPSAAALWPCKHVAPNSAPQCSLALTTTPSLEFLRRMVGPGGPLKEPSRFLLGGSGLNRMCPALEAWPRPEMTGFRHRNRFFLAVLLEILTVYASEYGHFLWVPGPQIVAACSTPQPLTLQFFRFSTETGAQIRSL